ncbi:MAG: DUF2905 domain-containing protein [Deltaproteobacteria bacterium]|nr:DUF2905 domain-containing protein [Deltaproteobacteria bacterium]
MGLWTGFGKMLIVLGLVVTAVGILLVIAPKVPWLGRLPGDIAIKKEHFHFYFPLTTCIIISIILSVLFYLFRK